ncbi:hypothetical protein [Lacticaseibacillus jixiensis]|uniref:hypothetical protein n=1 Tax=Lacticaseibacillus jixiensis TaxID=3231926 RepID=UPI0036F3BC60
MKQKIIQFNPVSADGEKPTFIFNADKLPGNFNIPFALTVAPVDKNSIMLFNFIVKNENGDEIINDKLIATVSKLNIVADRVIDANHVFLGLRLTSTPIQVAVSQDNKPAWFTAQISVLAGEIIVDTAETMFMIRRQPLES